MDYIGLNGNQKSNTVSAPLRYMNKKLPTVIVNFILAELLRTFE